MKDNGKPVSGSPILMLCWNFPPAVGGIEHVARNVCRQLRIRGRDVRVIARYSDAPDEYEAHRPDAPGLWRYLVFSLRHGIRQIRLTRPSVIVCPGIIDALVAKLFTVWFRIPYVVLAHGTDIVREGFIYQRIVRYLFRSATAIAANSHNTREELIKRGCRGDRITVIHPGVEEMVRAVTHPRPGPGPVLLTAGRIIRRKGIGEFITHVLPRLVEQFPNLTYVVAGDNASQSLVHHEPLLGALKRQVQTAGLSGHVLFTGTIDDEYLFALYTHADLFILPVIPVPGDIEGFGIVLMEAARQGVPSVATRCGGIPDAVDDGKTGMLVDPLDWNAMAKAISELLKQNERRRTMGEAARSRAVRDFAWPVIGQQYHDWLLDIERALR